MENTTESQRKESVAEAAQTRACGPASKGSEANARKRNSGMHWSVVLTGLVTTFVLVVSTLATTPSLLWHFQPLAVEPLGVVKKLAYLCGSGARTELQLENESLLLEGAARVPLNTPVEIRHFYLGEDAVCIPGSMRCWRLLSWG